MVGAPLPAVAVFWGQARILEATLGTSTLSLPEWLWWLPLLACFALSSFVVWRAVLARVRARKKTKKTLLSWPLWLSAAAGLMLGSLAFPSWLAPGSLAGWIAASVAPLSQPTPVPRDVHYLALGLTYAAGALGLLAAHRATRSLPGKEKR